MKKIIVYTAYFFALLVLLSCTKENANPVANKVTLHFNNTFKNTKIILGDAQAATATVHTSAEGQIHHFSELKYVISNIRLIKAEGGEMPYQINNLDKGARVIDQAKLQSLDFILENIPSGEYTQLKFGLGIKAELNILDQVRFPLFYAEAGANDTKMHWEWGAGYRFTKIEGFYGVDQKTLSIHTGSTVVGTNGDPASYTQGIDAYREISLHLPNTIRVGRDAPEITINADFDKLLSGRTNTIKLASDNATPPVHTAANMLLFVDNLGGDGLHDFTGMFSISKVTQ